MTVLVFNDDPYARSTTANVVRCADNALVFDRTVFYPLGGGQAGDTGVVERANGERIAVLDTRRDRETGEVLHLVEAGPGDVAVGEPVVLHLDWDRRYTLMRFHTALHLMSSVVGAPISGCNIAPDKARIDFDIDMSLLDAGTIEREVNQRIESRAATTARWITELELDAQPELVKTMSVQPPRGAGRVRVVEIAGMDVQPCGGTHVRNVDEIGPIRVVRIRSEGKKNKRVEIVFADCTV